MSLPDDAERAVLERGIEFGKVEGVVVFAVGIGSASDDAAGENELMPAGKLVARVVDDSVLADTARPRDGDKNPAANPPRRALLIGLASFIVSQPAIRPAAEASNYRHERRQGETANRNRAPDATKTPCGELMSRASAR